MIDLSFNKIHRRKRVHKAPFTRERSNIFFQMKICSDRLSLYYTVQLHKN